MKESSHARSRRHDRNVPSRKNEYGNREFGEYERTVLKERYHSDTEYKSDWKNPKRSKESHSKHFYHAKNERNERRSESPHHDRRSHHRRSPAQSNTDLADHRRSKKHQNKNDVNESYEELSRRKRRIESELHALDLEEAAQREAENKKTRRDISDDTSRRTEALDTHIKEEPVSDDDNRHNRQNNSQRNKHKHHSSKASGSEQNWGKPQSESKKVDQNKEKPNFSVSGKLAEDTNTYNGVVIKYNEPAEARRPRRRWRLYPFKGDSDLPFIPIHRQSAYLFGRSRLIADIPIDHPSCSKQHAVLQFRLVSYKREDGTTGKRVRPYIIDLESSNGTFVNNKKVEPRCYVELMEKDVIKFGYSTREYVILHEESKDNFEDDDVIETNE